MSNTESSQAFDQFAKATADLFKSVLIVCADAFQQVAVHLARLNTLFKATTPPHFYLQKHKSRRQWNRRRSWNRKAVRT